ncbi:MAG: Asp-tRNA(Asn)/Glu-tRNA(Gln) amidotransferase subunit GatB [Bacilli bacterium]|nr:Asp-tRNA(Asn)/Glu-tRNA(Gln) amidotransferase subunit GatB [Bacilli bacterium]
MGYKAMIGLEMHCEISETNTKVFSSARNSYSTTPNENIRPIDMGFPGVLPMVNKEAVKMALKASMVLNCKQPEYMYFERKNYYYPDMPKNYQITQETKPIPVGIYGYVDYECNGEEKRVRVNNIHLEEDAASLDHLYDTSVIDYNRAGVPLLELVTEPDFRSGEEAESFIEHMRTIYQYLGISEADTKKGQIRCDVNVSIMDENLDEEDPNNWGTKIEVKNVNSLGGVREAIKYEIKRQTALKEEGKYDEMPQQTRRWDEESGTTIFMRSKVDAVDYKYFVEPNIPKFKLSKEWLEEIRNSIPELAYDRKKKYINEYNLSEYDSNILVKDKKISDFFEDTVKLGTDPKEAANWVNGMVLSYLNSNFISIDEIYLTPDMLRDLIKLVTDKTISSKQAKDVFNKILEEKKEPMQIVKDEGMMQITDESQIESVVNEVLEENKEQALTYDPSNPKALDYFVGQVMKKTRGKANPSITSKLMKEKLDNLKNEN